MSDLKISISKTLVHEGGYVNNPADPGGATKYGVTQRDINGLPGFPANVADLTEDQAITYYLQYYWIKFGSKGKLAQTYYPQIIAQGVLDKLYDMSVLFGIGTAVQLLQIVLNCATDGAFGPNALAAVNQAEPVSLLQSFQTALVSHAIGIANATPSSRQFLAGWIRRINS